MGERFDTSRPIYAQIVERLKAKILAGVYPPGGHLDSAVSYTHLTLPTMSGV